VSEIQRITALPRLPPRRAEAHKGDFGRVLIVAGSRGMSGAAILCGSAALRGGAGLVTVACPENIWPIVAAGNPCYMTLPLADGDTTQLRDAAINSDIVVVGPGLGRSPVASARVAALLQSSGQGLLLDADALNAVAGSPGSLTAHSPERILTPHPGEFSRLAGIPSDDVQTRREEVTIAFAQKFGGVLILKGNGTLVCDGTRLYCNTTGNPGMATAGSGDVLSGLIGALWAQGLSAFDAAQLGVFLHGLAGDLARDQLGETSLTAADLLDYLPGAFLAHAAG
jgi:ADP-dependent NAD(P)H-hydrate dehydratase